MALSITSHAGAESYANPFISLTGTVNLLIDVSTLTIAEVDADGYLKPGVPFFTDGDLVAAAEPVYGCSIAPVRIAETNTTLATDPDILIAVGFGVINRDIGEDNLGRVYSATEIADFLLAGSNVHLTTT